ncbi:MAG: SDR family oxidoreductase [Actinophytocola sp.]|uniref:SDR family NAD(P)-dependent oxidoreductase n=1 Tax=Actinophytocola sp. TaxID=1872138 RepID=UPI00132BB4EA|nr:SDR family oxidoreductase [Actinophytocola sp.]MPZ82817.1 SDR family oxidoreductase [Actinophytocola sp.]
MDLQLSERVALVTGGSRGIGRAAALLLAREGARVAVSYRSAADAAAAVVAEIAAAGGTAAAVPLDLADHESIRSAVGSVVDRWGRLDVLVSNALDTNGLTLWPPTAFEELAASSWQPFLRANVDGPYAVAQAVVPVMRAQGFGRIVLVSGTSALDGQPFAAALATAKAALHGLVRTLTKELGPAGILVNAVLPGTTLTEHIEAVLPAAARTARESASPIRRLLGPAEVVPTVAFLGSPLNTGVTGELVRVSGGL